MMRSLLKVALGLLALAILAAIPVGWEAYQFLETPNPFAQRYTVGQGATLSKVAADLEEQRVVPSALYLRILGRFWKGGHIRAGEYQLEAGLRPMEVLEQLRHGKVVQHRLVIPEGFSNRDIIHLMAQKGWDDIGVLLSDPKTREKFGIKHPSMEGWLFPDTYFYSQGESAMTLVTRMVERTRKVLDEAWNKRAKGVDAQLRSPYEALIFASIIEKETGQGSERPRISAVFHNRLKIDMKLQSDPTVIYGIPDYDGDIKRKHLTTPTPYNTYTQHGLPPTPIANPGRAAIEAALNPIVSKELYFVARGDGSKTHRFSKTLKEHQHKVKLYLRELRKRRHHP